MIPKVAHFYWYSDEPLPELRRASVDSFSVVNPDWQVFVHHSGEDPNASFRTKVIRSDAARYGILYRAGGVYFDTDIVFVRPVPQHWLEKDLLLPACSVTHAMYGVHVMGAKPESTFFKGAMDKARLRLESNRALGCQSLGVKLWEGMDIFQLASRGNESVTPLPISAFLMTGWQDVEDVWSPQWDIDPRAVGVHWYGGDRLSCEYEHTRPEDLPESLVSKAFASIKALA